MGQYTEHVGKYDFSSQHFPVPLSSVGSFAVAQWFKGVEHISTIVLVNISVVRVRVPLVLSVGI